MATEEPTRSSDLYTVLNLMNMHSYTSYLVALYPGSSPTEKRGEGLGTRLIMYVMSQVKLVMLCKVFKP